MNEKELYLRQLLANKNPLDDAEVKSRFKELNINLGEHPYKIFGITHDGNRNEVEVFEDCFSTLQEAENFEVNKNYYHDKAIYIEEDE